MNQFELEPLSDDYLHARYGNSLDYFIERSNLFHTARICTQCIHGEANNVNHKAAQCDLLIEDDENEVKYSRLTYEERLKWHLREFCYKTSSHGIPMIVRASNGIYRIIWTVLFISCISMLLFQSSNIVEKYRRKNTIANLQLKFDTALFPSITICNLNPYKVSLIDDVRPMKRMLAVYNNIMAQAGRSSESAFRQKRDIVPVFEPIYSSCNCESDENYNYICLPQKNGKIVDKNKENECICVLNRPLDDIFPCYPKTTWTADLCETCIHGYCEQSSDLSNWTSSSITCLCPPFDSICLTYDGRKPIVHLRQVLLDGKQNAALKHETSDYLDALGFTNMTDQVAIVNKAKENMLFAMSELDEIERIKLSIQKRELIQKCSFDGEACDIENDFLTLVDPNFGNCYIFNHNRTKNTSSIRAGPMYGR